MATRDQALLTLNKLARQIVDRRPELKRLDDYYTGKHPLAFATAEFRAAFGGLFDAFADNWCAVVPDSTAERLTVTGVRLGSGPDTVDSKSWSVWQRNGLDADSGLAFLDALVLRRSYGLVWANPDDETAEITFEHPSQATVDYVPGSRRRRAAGLKLWTDGTRELATLYLPDEVWKFQRRSGAASALLWTPPHALLGAGGWELRTGLPSGELNPQPNPLGEVPMVELVNRPRLLAPAQSEIDTVIPMQDAVNLLWSHLLTASDFAALPQRIVLGAERPKRAVYDADGNKTGEVDVPLSDVMIRRILWLEDPEAKTNEWGAADLENYTKVIETAVGHIAAQTRTPQHYLIGKMANLSADALKAAETGLVSKVGERMTYFGEAVRELLRLAALVEDDTARAEQLATATVLWKDPESRSEAEKVDAALKLKSLGVPFSVLMKRVGYSETEIEGMEALRDREAARAGLGDLAALVAGPRPPAEPVEPPPAA